MTPGGPALTRDEWTARVAEWFPHLTDAKAGSLNVRGDRRTATASRRC